MANIQNVKTDSHFLLIVGLISISMVASELIWTRIFSAELFYTFAFLTLSIAVLGLGLGALSIRLFHFLHKHWDAMSKIKVFENDPDNWDINVGNLIQRLDNTTFLSLGAGGGMDVLQALSSYGADEIHAVEVNPHINKMLQDGDTAGYLAIDDEQGQPRTFTTSNIFSGQIYNDPRVKVISEDARTYVRRFENKFDVIYSLSSNTFAPLGSGSFAFAENYLLLLKPLWITGKPCLKMAFW